MSRLFTPFAIGSICLRNRCVRSATGESAADADSGQPTQWQSGATARAACIFCGGCRATPECCNLCALDS